MEDRITKRDVLIALIEAIDAGDVEINDSRITLDDIKDYAEEAIIQIDMKNERSRIRSLEKRREIDKLRADVKAALTDEFQTGDQILAKIEGDNITKAKVVSRLSDLIKHNEAIKDNITNEYGSRIVVYKKI